MTFEQHCKNLTSPSGKIDVILDTDAYNEIDDQFAIAYMLFSPEKFNIKGFTAAPFLNGKSVSAEDGMLKSYDEILKLLKLAGREDLTGIVFEGSREYLPDEKTPVKSPAAEFIAKLSDEYSPEKPLYVVAIGAITNVASAILLNPAVKENTVVIWLGGHANDIPKPASEFNMNQDIAGSRVLIGSGVPFVQLPCFGVVDHLTTTGPELQYWLGGKNPLADYLCRNTIEEAESYAKGKPWSRVIWDISAVAWLLNDNNRFMSDKLSAAPIPQYDRRYSFDPTGHFIKYVYSVNRDAIFEDLFRKITKE